MATWATVADARRFWADAPDDDDLLTALLDAAQEVAEVYAPALKDGAPVPARYTQAVVLQAREIWQAVERDGDVLGFDGEYAVRVRPLSASVKQLLRPQRAVPSFGVEWPEETEEPDVSYAELDKANTFTESQTLASSFDGGEDDGSAESFDSTSRLNLESYQRASFDSFGETVRHFLRRKDAKAMVAYYFPEGGYDANREPVGEFVPVVWHGAHWEGNSHLTNHKHWSVETPDSTGALQTRFEVRFGDRDVDDAVSGLDVTQIMTNNANLVIRCSSGEVLRLSADNATHKDIEYSLDHEGGSQFRRWALRHTATTDDFQIVRYDETGAYQGPAVAVKNSTGRVGIGTNDPTNQLDIDGDSIRVRQSQTPASATAFGQTGEIAWDADYMYICVAPSTWKRAALEGGW